MTWFDTERTSPAPPAPGPDFAGGEVEVENK